MSEVTASMQAPRTVAEFKAALARLLEKMDDAEERMKADRREIEKARLTSQLISERTDTAHALLADQVQSLARPS